MPANVVQIGQHAFCTIESPYYSLIPTYIRFFDCQDTPLLKKIGEGAFLYSPFYSVVIPEGFEELSPLCFAEAHCIRFLQLPSTIKKIGEYPFAKQAKIENIVWNIDKAPDDIEYDQYSFSFSNDKCNVYSNGKFSSQNIIDWLEGKDLSPQSPRGGFGSKYWISSSKKPSNIVMPCFFPTTYNPVPFDWFKYDEKDSNILVGFNDNVNWEEHLDCDTLMIPKNVTEVATEAFGGSFDKNHFIPNFIKYIVFEEGSQIKKLNQYSIIADGISSVFSPNSLEEMDTVSIASTYMLNQV